jgi:hypothetical protein
MRRMHFVVIFAVTANAASAEDIIKRGTPMSYGQYCTAKNGSSQNCNLKRAFRNECADAGMQFYDGVENGTGPQARCIAK